MHDELKAILIGGSSHVGKSSVAKSLAEALGWKHVPTDSLARHPGRPWKTAPEKVPDDVADHYLNLSADELIEDVLRHYWLNVWPKVETIIASHAKNPSSTGIVLEGSAIWPEFATSLDFNNAAALWLTTSDDVFRQRIHNESTYNAKTDREKKMIDKFLARTLAYNTRMVKTVRSNKLPLIHVHDAKVPVLAERCLSALGIHQPTR